MGLVHPADSQSQSHDERFVQCAMDNWWPSPEKVPSAGAFEAQADSLKGYIRGRVLPGLPIKLGFREHAC